MTTLDEPVYAVPDPQLVPVGDYLRELATIPPSRMFLINKSLASFRAARPGTPVFDASQGDGGASLPGVPHEVLERAHALQLQHGTAYDMPFGTEAYRRAVVEQYWQLGAGSGIGPANVVATHGGRDALAKAYTAMLALGHGRLGDPIVVSRVPWISYTWGPYGVGANVMLAPGRPQDGWAITQDGLEACATLAARSGRKLAGLIITSPDNPTGRTLTPDAQAELARAALRQGVAYVLFDWMYHYVTDAEPMDLAAFLARFSPAERRRLIFLDGITKSLGGSGIRNCHLIAAEDVIQFIVARASHAIIPSFHSQAVAMAAYELGYARVTRGIVEPTNESRALLRGLLAARGARAILGQGYYAFIHVGRWLATRGWTDTEPLAQYLAEQVGIAVVPAGLFSSAGACWLRFSYALPAATTQAAAKRLFEGLDALQ